MRRLVAVLNPSLKTNNCGQKLRTFSYSSCFATRHSPLASLTMMAMSTLGAPPPTTVAEEDGLRPDPPNNLDQTGHLVLGPGARRDTTGMLGTTLPKLTLEQQISVQKAKKYAMEQSIKMVLMKQTMAHQQKQAKSMERHQAVVLMCRVYVGSISFEVKEETIRQAFLPFGPIRSISMSWDPITQKHKGFAFVEYEMPEAAQLGLEQMNGVIISGRNIKVGRPSNMPQAQIIIDDVTREAKDFNRIYIASIHQDLTEEDIKSVFEAFGTIVSCELAMTVVPGRHKGYGFIEYQTTQAAHDAIANMNLFDLGGQYLRVGRAITPPDTPTSAPPSSLPQIMPTAAAVAAAAATAKIQAMDAVATNLGMTSAQSDAAAAAATAPAAPRSAPRVSGFGPPVSGTIPPPGIMAPQVAHVQAVLAAPQHVAAAVPPPTLMTTPITLAGPTPSTSVQLPPMPSVPAAAPPPPPSVPVPPVHDPAAMLAKSQADAQKAQQEQLQKKLMEGQEPSTLQQQENMSIKGQEARHLVMQKLMRTQSESVVVLLKNMVGSEDVDEDLQEEIQEECSKYGEVEGVIIYQERQSEEDNAEVLVKIFVEFKETKSAKAAKDSLNGRFFAGRRVTADIYDQALYEDQDYSG